MKSFFKEKTILITGNTGFKGSWLTLILHHLGANVIGYSLEAPSNPSMFEVMRLDNKITQFTKDIRDEESLFSIINEYKPSIVFHMAAQALVRKSYIEPKLTYETNIMGTVNLFEAIRRSNCVKTVINITSDKCYENKEWVYPYRENEPMGGYDPYSSSKGCAELITSAYQRSFFHDHQNTDMITYLSSVRAGNVIGGGDWAEDRIIPDFIRAISSSKKLTIRSPKSIRPWQHVFEPLFGYLLLAKTMWENGYKYTGGWNFGPNDDEIVTVEEIVKVIISLWGKGEYEVHENHNLHEAGLLKLDISKAKYYLKWKPLFSVKEALIKTVEWYKHYYDNDVNSVYELSISQIQEYYNRFNHT